MPEILFNNNNTLRQQVDENTENIKKILESHLVDVDDELSTQSTNAVQNKVITEALNTEEFERKQADEDLENADTTLQGNIDAETLARQQADQNLQNQLTPTSWQSLTRDQTNTTNVSCGRYFQIGKLVVVYLRVTTTADCPDTAGILFTGLPAPELTSTLYNELILCLNGSNISKATALRIKITNTGEIQTWYTTASNYTSDGIDEIFCYLAQ